MCIPETTFMIVFQSCLDCLFALTYESDHNEISNTEIIVQNVFMMWSDFLKL